jgi:hypothetical protein
MLDYEKIEVHPGVFFQNCTSTLLERVNVAHNTPCTGVWGILGFSDTTVTKTVKVRTTIPGNVPDFIRNLLLQGTTGLEDKYRIMSSKSSGRSIVTCRYFDFVVDGPAGRVSAPYTVNVYLNPEFKDTGVSTSKPDVTVSTSNTESDRIVPKFIHEVKYTG